MSGPSVRRLLRRRGGPAIRSLAPAEFTDYLAEAFTIYTAAMGYPSTYAQPRMQLAREQLELPDATAVGAFDGPRMVGFGYGYASRPGQWWHDDVATGLARHPHGTAWLADAFELCELHVAPAQQGRGTGRLLLQSLVRRAPSSTVLLSTPRSLYGATPAIALYESAGFVHLVPNHRFGGDPRDFSIMGLRRVADDSGG